MTRPLRIEYCGAWYHVMNRGAGRRTVFESSDSCQEFLGLLNEVSSRFMVQVHAYCLMKNHYHLLLHTPLPNLNKVMKSIGGIYTQRINRIIKTDGSLFRGRYKAILVDVDSYLLQLSRSIHLNPVTAKIVNQPEKYPWSSYRYYISSENKPDWLYYNETLNHFGRKDPILLYKKFVLEGVDKEIMSFYDNLKKTPILGSDSFVKELRHVYNLRETDADPYHKYKLVEKGMPTIAEIINGVSVYFKLDPTDVKERQKAYSKKNASNLAVYLSVEMSGESQEKIGVEFNGISTSRVSQIYGLVRRELLGDTVLLRKIQEIKRDILTLKT